MNETETTHLDVYSIVTNRIIELLEKGVLPWKQPWTGAGAPMNAISKNTYRGINLLLLATLGYDRNLFLTFKQIKDLNASVNRGESGHVVCFWKKKENEHSDADDLTDTSKRYRSILRYYKVFNVSQCSGLPTWLEREIIEQPIAPLRQCELIVQGMPNPPLIVHKKPEAYYEPASDLINMPKPSKFKSAESYHSVLFHELIHSTGHTSRINRKEVMETGLLGKESYSIEELTAEIGASFLNALCGIENTVIEESVAYIAGWLNALKNDKRFIFQASGRAQYAVDFILQETKVEDV